MASQSMNVTPGTSGQESFHPGPLLRYSTGSGVNVTPGTSGQEPFHLPLRPSTGSGISGRSGTGQKDKKSPMEQQVEIPKRKKRKTSDLNTKAKEVKIESKPNNDGVVWRGTYTSYDAEESIEYISDHIKEEDTLCMENSEVYDLYPAFKEALLMILKQIDKSLTSENDPVGIILVHGGPNIGKSALAKCLALLLSLSTGKEAVHLIKLCHSERVDNSVLTGCITDACSQEYVIVDQVNTNSLIRGRIINFVKKRMKYGKNKMPLVMFTSGHYTPNEEWTHLQKSEFLCYKIISMQVNDAFLSILRKSREIVDDSISNDALLKVTTFYPQMIKCLDHLEYDNPNAGEDDLRKAIYPGADSRLIREKSMAHFIFLVWRKFIQNELPPLAELTDNDLNMDPRRVHYLGYLISEIKDARDRGINAILNSIEIMGDAEYTKDGYTEFKCDSYYYTWSYKNILYDVLVCARKHHSDVSRAAKHKMLLEAYLIIEKEGNSNFAHIRGGLFEMIIEHYFEKKKKRGLKFGMKYISESLRIEQVDHYVKLATVSKLCDLPLKYKSCKEAVLKFWCVLNVPGKKPFEGFDFAFMQTKPGKDEEDKEFIPVVEILQLFQVTINPKGKSAPQRENMAKVMGEIIRKLSENKLINKGHNVVFPYFVQPSHEGEVKPLTLEGSITADVINIPPKVLQ